MKIKIGDKVRVENKSDLLRNRNNSFKDFEGTIISLHPHVFGYWGEVLTTEGIKLFDSEVHKLSLLFFLN